jgi:hypothetical protein
MSTNKELEDVKIDSYRRESKKYRIKSYVTFLIIIAIIFLVLLFLGSFGNDLFGLIVFLVIFSVPAILIFRNKLPNILPDFITDSLFEIDNSEDTQPIYNVSKRTTQLANLFGVGVLLLGSIVLIIKYRNQLEDPMSFYKIMSSMICLVFAGIILSNITGDELTIGSSMSEA